MAKIDSSKVEAADTAAATERRAVRQPELAGLTGLSRIARFGLIIAVVVCAVAVFGAMTYRSHQQTARDIAAARSVSDQVIAAMATQNTKRIVALGNAQFQRSYSPAQLNSLLTFQTSPPLTFAKLYGDEMPSLTRTTATTSSSGKHVTFVYTYHKLKVPFLVRVDVSQPTGASRWTLNGLSAAPGSPDPNAASSSAV